MGNRKNARDSRTEDQRQRYRHYLSDLLGTNLVPRCHIAHTVSVPRRRSAGRILVDVHLSVGSCVGMLRTPLDSRGMLPLILPKGTGYGRVGRVVLRTVWSTYIIQVSFAKRWTER